MTSERHGTNFILNEDTNSNAHNAQILPVRGLSVFTFLLSFNKLRESAFKTRCWAAEAHRGVNYKVCNALL
jgi:hypothetical protein